MTRPFHTVVTTGLSKRYGLTRALVDATATFEAGETTTVEGPNGSGKSTLLRLLAQLAKPTRGTIKYGSISDKSARPHIAFVGHSAHLYEHLSGEENLLFFAELYGVTKARVDSLKSRLALSTFFHRPASTYSRGQRQRISLARGILASPTLLLLDEPTTGLDKESVEILERTIEEERLSGAIVVLVTHDASFASRVATSRLTLREGRSSTHASKAKPKPAGEDK